MSYSDLKYSREIELLRPSGHRTLKNLRTIRSENCHVFDPHNGGGFSFLVTSCGSSLYFIIFQRYRQPLSLLREHLLLELEGTLFAFWRRLRPCRRNAFVLPKKSICGNIRIHRVPGEERLLYPCHVPARCIDLFMEHENLAAAHSEIAEMQKSRI
jgi:hypothetical protein